MPKFGEVSYEEDVANQFMRMVNRMNFDKKAFAKVVTTEHRTLQQSAFGLMLVCIEEWSKMPDSFTDLRNEETVKKCRKIAEALDGDFHVPFV